MENKITMLMTWREFEKLRSLVTDNVMSSKYSMFNGVDCQRIDDSGSILKVTLDLVNAPSMKNLSQYDKELRNEGN